MEDLIEKVIKGPEESDRHYQRMEEKWLEMEDRHQKESREFQSTIMSVISKQGAGFGLQRPQTNYYGSYSSKLNAQDGSLNTSRLIKENSMFADKTMYVNNSVVVSSLLR